MNPLDVLGLSPLLSVIGWTAAASCTIGGAVAALVVCCRRVAPRMPATWQHRVVLAVYALSLAVAFAIAVVPRPYGLAADHGRPAIGLPLAAALVPAPPGRSLFTAPAVNARDWIRRGVALAAMTSILLGALALVRLVVGLWMVRRLRRQSTPIADADLIRLLASLADRMRIRRHIELRESVDIDTAITGGWRRPFVLLPPGMAGALGAAIEPVLLHELAHVRRRDFPLAVLQAVADAFTRLSPGHRWLSLEAGRLREQACDDVVVTMGVEPLRYAHALEALGKWSRGVHVTTVVCAANRDLAARVRRLLDGPRKTRTLTVLGALAALCIGALATTVVAAFAPGLPVVPALRHQATVPPTLISGRDALATPKRKSAVDYFYNPEAAGPFRISAMTFYNDDTATATIQSVYPKRIVAMALGREARRTPALSPGDLFVERSVMAQVVIDPGKSSSASFVFAPITLSSLFRTAAAAGSRVQAQYYPAYARFEDGTEWSGGAAVAQLLTIPRALVSSDAHLPLSAGERMWICYDAEGHETSEGGIAPIREDQNKWVRCTNGRWLPTKSPVPPDASLLPPH